MAIRLSKPGGIPPFSSAEAPLEDIGAWLRARFREKNSDACNDGQARA